MAEADIAYVATAGAAGLALALSAWAARLRGRLAARNRVAEAELAAALVDLADRDGALAAFEDVRLALTPDGQTRRLGSPQAWNALTRELAHDEDHERDPGLVVLDAARRAAGRIAIPPWVPGSPRSRSIQPRVRMTFPSARSRFYG